MRKPAEQLVARKPGDPLADNPMIVRGPTPPADPMKCCIPHCNYEPSDIVSHRLGVEYDVCEAHRPDVEVRVYRGDMADLIERSPSRLPG